MKFSTPEGKLETPELTADYEAARRFEKTRVGALGVFFPSGFGTKFIPYSYIDRAFIRVHEVDGKLCCGKATFYYYRIVFVHDGKEFADIMSENEELTDAALAAIAKNAPSVQIGFTPQTP